jgi:hypothetical protein
MREVLGMRNTRVLVAVVSLAIVLGTIKRPGDVAGPFLVEARTQGATVTSSPAMQVPKEPIDEFHVFFDLRDLVPELAGTLSRPDNEVKQASQDDCELVQALKETQDGIEFLLDKWQPTMGSGVTTRPYLLSLTYDVYLLKTAKALPRRQACSKIRDVAEDLKIKVNHCRGSNNLNPKITVTVVTKNNQDNEVQGYQIWYVQKGMEDVPSCFDSFHKFSSPTDEKELVPGRYVMWGKKGDLVTTHVAQRIGGEGKNQIQIDLPVE